MTIPLGTHICHYEIRSLLGAGGMGEVYLAHDTRLKRLVALKLLSPKFVENPDSLRRFEQEACAASALNHPNILTVYEIGCEDNTHFIATEFIDGKTLRQHIATTRMKIDQVLDVSIQAASALSAAHAAGIVHRDIKPDNIMLRRDGYVRVLDFGLAKLAENQPSDPEAGTIEMVNTAPGIVMGTASYMSPEQARGFDLDARTDIWSFGAVLYEMLTGHLAFAGATTSDIIVSVLEREPVPLARHLPGVPGELQRIIKKCLRKDREERYQSAKDLALDLKNLRRDMEIEAEIERSGIPPLVPVSSGHSGQTPSEREQSSSEAPVGHVTATIPTALTGQLRVPPTLSSAEYIVRELKTHKKGVSVVAAVLTIAVLGGRSFSSERPITIQPARPVSSR